MFWPCETRTSTCRNFATISSGVYRFFGIAVLLHVKRHSSGRTTSKGEDQYAYHISLLAFLCVSLVSYYLCCHISPNILNGATKVFGNVDAEKTFQDVPPHHAQATCGKCLAMNPNFPDGP